jgi:hypothetical protein
MPGSKSLRLFVVCMIALLGWHCTERVEPEPVIILRFPFGEFDEQYHINYDGRALTYKGRLGHDDQKIDHSWVDIDSVFALLRYADSIGFYQMDQGTRYKKETDHQGRVIKETPMDYVCSIRIQFKRPSFNLVRLYSDSPTELWTFVDRIRSVVQRSSK